MASNVLLKYYKDVTIYRNLADYNNFKNVNKVVE